MTGEKFAERDDAVDAHDVEQLLTAVREVLAQVVADLDACLAQLVLQQLGDERYAAAARRSRPCSLTPATSVSPRP
jgi:hypothetical protein